MAMITPNQTYNEGIQIFAGVWLYEIYRLHLHYIKHKFCVHKSSLSMNSITY